MSTRDQIARQELAALLERPPQMPWRTERTPGHGSDCVCEWCFLAPPLPTVADNMDALTEIAASLRRIEKLLTIQARPPQARPSSPTPPPPNPTDALP